MLKELKLFIPKDINTLIFKLQRKYVIIYLNLNVNFRDLENNHADAKQMNRALLFNIQSWQIQDIM